MLVGEVATVDDQGINRRIFYCWRCVRRSVHERKLISCAAWALNKIQITDSVFQNHEVAFQVSVGDNIGWLGVGSWTVEMLVSSVANSKYAIPERPALVKSRREARGALTEQTA